MADYQRALTLYKNGDIPGALALLEDAQTLPELGFKIRLLVHMEQYKEARVIYEHNIKPVLASYTSGSVPHKEAVELLDTLNNMSFYFSIIGKPIEYINYAQELLQDMNYDHDVEQVGTTLYNIGELEYLVQKFDPSVEYLQMAEDYILAHPEYEMWDTLFRTYVKLSQNYTQININKAFFYIERAKDILRAHGNSISQTHRLLFKWQMMEIELEKHLFDKMPSIAHQLVDELQATTSLYLRKLILEYILFVYAITGYRDLAMLTWMQIMDQLQPNDKWWGVFNIDKLFLSDTIDWEQLFTIIGTTVHYRNTTDLFTQRFIEWTLTRNIDKYELRIQIQKYLDTKLTQRTVLFDELPNVLAYLDSIGNVPTLDAYFSILQAMFTDTVSRAELRDQIFELLFGQTCGTLTIYRLAKVLEKHWDQLLDNDSVRENIKSILTRFLSERAGKKVEDPPDYWYMLFNNIVHNFNTVYEFDDILASIYDFLEMLGYPFCFTIAPITEGATVFVGGNTLFMNNHLVPAITVDELYRFTLYIKLPDDNITTMMLKQFYIKLLAHSVSKAFTHIYGTIDGLTGAYNQSTGRDILQRLLYAKLSGRTDASTISLVFIDIDNFKRINDTLGHNTGDKVLIDLSRHSINTLRKTDYVIRWGGDEFILVLTNDPQHKIRSAKQIENIVQRIKIEFKSKSSVASLVDFSYGFILDKQIERILEEASAQVLDGDQTAIVNIALRNIIQYADKRMFKQKRSKKVK